MHASSGGENFMLLMTASKTRPRPANYNEFL